MGKVNDFWKRVGHYKYTVVLVLFVLIICFLDQNSLVHRWQYRQQRVNLEKEIEYYEAMRDSSIEGLRRLDKDTSNMERIAREKYGMHLPNEEVFVVK